MVDVSMLVSGIVALVIGLILFAVRQSNYFPPIANKIAEIAAIILSIVGIIVIVLSVLLPLVPAGYLT